MELNPIFQKAVLDIHIDRGVEATFTHGAGTPVACHPIMRQEPTPQPGGYEAQVPAIVTTITVPIEEIVDTPVAGDTFTTTAATYTVQGPPIENNGYVCKVVVI
ncbi:MAG: hypothetical protein HY770_06320 [Chitinivibrionia bacterium]|nr:hypothetical protein [Chitinivibrionia bacterium]